MKRKIVAIFAMFLMLSMPLGIVQASETKKESNIRLEIETVGKKGNILNEEIITNAEELQEFQNIIKELFEKLKNAENFDTILNILLRFSGKDNKLFNKVFKLFTKTKMIGNRAFVFSSGACYDLNPLKQDQFKIRKRSTFWRYSTGTINPRTLILKPFKLDSDILTGTQFGFMRKFTGIYIHISRTIPEKSYTFFMGTAKNAIGLDFQGAI